MTQAELAERLGVTFQAVSRWETGRGFPDISLLEPLAKALDLSVTALINGACEPADENSCSDAANDKQAERDRALLDTLREGLRMMRTAIGILLLLFGIGALLTVTSGNIVLPAILLLALAFLFLFGGKLFAFFGGWMMKRYRLFFRILSRIAPLAALVLEIIPGGAVLIFGSPEGSLPPSYYSCFSLTPFGYANFWPLLTALITCALILIGILSELPHFRGAFRTPLFVLAFVGFVLSVMPIFFFGTRYYTAIAAGITFCLLTSAVAELLGR